MLRQALLFAAIIVISLAPWLTGGPVLGQRLKVCTAPNPGKAVPGAPKAGGFGLVGDLDRKWDRRTVIKVRFMGGDAALRLKVENYAKDWSRFANIYLDFGDHKDADIRISFQLDKGSWSYIGKDALRVAKNQPTMNFGWFTASTSDQEIRRTTLHEFGHALGFIHEHQSPKGGIQWDRPKTYEYYKRTQGWEKADVDNNVFKQTAVGSVNASSFDSKSIMLYPIPKELTTNGFSTEMNTALSEMDKRHAARLYPWTPHSLVSLKNDTTANIHFQFRWKGDTAWRELSAKRLTAGRTHSFWSNAGTEAKFRDLEVRFDNGKKRTITTTLANFGWRPRRVGDYPDFNGGGRFSFVYRSGELVIERR